MARRVVLGFVPTADDGVLIAVSEGSYGWGVSPTLSLQRFAADGSSVGPRITLAEGTMLIGALAVDSTSDRYALLRRSDDAMFLTSYDRAGTLLFEVRLVGGVDHGVVGSQWADTGVDFGGALAWTGSDWAAYFAITQHWPDGISHQGDTMRRIAADGTEVGGGWSWGCSHSLAQRLAIGEAGLAPVCVSDAFPFPGLVLEHAVHLLGPPAGTQVSWGNMPDFGEVLSTPSGVWIAFSTAWDRTDSLYAVIGDVALVRRTPDGVVHPPIWLTSTREGMENNVRFARFEGGFLLGYVSGSSDSNLVRLDSEGAIVGSVETGGFDAPWGLLSFTYIRGRFMSFPNGDVGWLSRTGDPVLYRLAACR